MLQSDTLFEVARELDQAAHFLRPISYEDLSLEARSFLGVTLDYMKVPRKKFLSLFPLAETSPSDSDSRSGELPLKSPKSSTGG